MADSTIISASLSDKDIKESIDKLVKHVDEGMNKMVASTNSAVAKMRESIKSLGDLKVDFGGSADGGSSKITKKQQELTQEVKNTNAVLKQSEITYDHIAQGIQAATKAQSDGARKYTEEILKQAKAIRESASWKETGHYLSSTGDVFYDKERASSTKREKEHMLSLEDQLVQAEQRRIDVERQASLELQTQTQAQNQLTQAAKGTQQIYESIQAMQVRSNKDVRAGGVKNTSFQNYEDFRMALAAILGLQKEEIVLADSERASYEKLNTTLKQLRDTYNKLNASERDSENGKALVSSMLEVERSIQKIQRAAARPVSLESIIGINGKGGLSENTLDDIAYKMQKLQLYRSGLDTNTQKGEIEQVNEALKRLGRTQRDILGENESLLKSNNALARSFNYMKNRLAFYFTVGAATQFIKQLIDIRSQYEMNERALGILIDSAEKGSQIFNELSQMSLVSPYTLIELTNAARQLTAYGVAARDVVDTTRRLADVAAAVGAPIERISYALGHIQSYGYLTSLQARQFANSGIPLVKELANRYSELEGRVITTADVYDRMKKKQVEYADVMDVINRMTDEGGRFFDFQAKMADTLKVRLANLNLAWNNMLNDMGKSSQGLLTWTIGSLRTLFTHWKQLDQAIRSAAWAGGLIVAVRALNVLLVKAGANFGILSASMTTTQIAGKGIASTLGNVIGSFKALVTTPLTWWSLLAFAIVDAWRDLKNLNEAQKEFNKSLRDAGNNNAKSLTDFYNQYNGGAKKISADDAKKVWEEMREQIELTVKKSDMFVGTLLRIDDVSKRLKVGFELINDINEVNAALKELDDDSIKMEADFSKWWNLNIWPDGLVENIQNYTKAQKELYEYSMKGESLSKMEEDAKELEDKFLDLQGAISITTGSIYDLIKLKGWEGNINKINALYDQVFGNLAEKYNLSPSEAFNMQMAAEKSRSIATEKALQIRIADERAALKAATDEVTRYEILKRKDALEQEFRFFVQNTSEQRVYWRDFTNWIKTQHLSETQAMFKGMNAEQIKSLNFQEGKYFEWVDRLTKQYAKEHYKSYTETFDLLKNYVTNANQMSIFIPLVIGGENKKSVYQTLTEADQAADTAWQKIERLNTRIAELSKNETSNAEQLTEAQAELSQAYQDYNDAIAKGGHSKKETTKATKDQKAAESELQKALKEEIQLLDKARSVYKQLTKEGVDSNRALAVATEGYEETITHINSVLQKYGIQKFNLAAYAGVQNPHAITELLQGQRDTLLKSGVAKPEEIKDLQVKLKDVKVDEVTFNQKTLTDSLNNELGKLKEEYELGVEFDANPELGSIFADMMGMGREEMNKLPRTYAQLAKKMQESIDNVFADNDVIGKFDLEKMLNKADFDKWVEERGNKLDDSFITALNKIREEMNKVRQKEAEDTVKNWSNLISKYGTIQDKLVSISKDTAKEELDVIKQFGSDEEIASAIDLAEKINVSRTPQEVARLQKELTELLKKVAEGKNTAISVKAAIEKSEGKNKAKAIWDDFKDSDEYIKMFDNLEYLSIGALDNIMNKLEEVKDKVREDPASMKAVFDSMEKVREATMNLDPARGMAEGFKSFIQGTRELSTSSKAIKETEKYLKSLRKELVDTQNELSDTLLELEDATGSGDEDRRLKAQLKFNELKAKEKELNEKISEQEGKQNDLQEDHENALEKIQKGLEHLAEGAQKWGNKLQNVSDAISAVGNVFAAIGDEETSESINDLNKGFQIMIGVLDAVAAACIVVKVALGAIYLVAMAIAGVFMGLAFLFEGSANRAITRQINESEATVRKLELAYKDLEAAIEDAYGAAEYGLKQAEISNKKLQLAELKRQLELEKSRSGKHYDQEKVDEYLEKVKDLENEIANMVEDITNDMLGIQSVGNAAEELVSSMIDAFRKGEDYMASYQDTFDKMIENMIVKAIASRVIGDRLQEIWDTLDATISERSKPQREEIKKIQENIADYEKKIDEAAQDKLNAERLYLYPGLAGGRLKEAVEKYDKYTKLLDEENKKLQEAIEAASNAGQITPQDVNEIASMASSFKGEAMENFKALMDAFGIKFGDLAGEQELSNLQQGISSISENTALAIEAYLNGISQQIYLHSEILTDIRDTLHTFDFGEQLGVQSEILLQLQNGYQTMNAMRTMMENWQTPSGNGIRVEML